MKRKALLTSLASLLMLGSASAQTECDIFGCPDDGSGDTSTETGGDEPAESPTPEPIDEPADADGLALPDPASDRAVEASAGGLATANGAIEGARNAGHARAGK